MRSRQFLVLALAVLAAGAIAACSSSNGPSSLACTGHTPNLAGTWSLYTIDQGQGAIGPPAATGSFTFTGDSVAVDLTLPVIGDLTGSGACSLTASRITITNFLGAGDATGPYTFKAGPPDTLTASIVSSGITTTVVVTRP